MNSSSTARAARADETCLFLGMPHSELEAGAYIVSNVCASLSTAKVQFNKANQRGAGIGKRYCIRELTPASHQGTKGRAVRGRELEPGHAAIQDTSRTPRSSHTATELRDYATIRLGTVC